MKNRDEYIAGTDPLDAASFLEVQRVSVSSPAQITFQAVSNRTYTIQYKDDLSAPVWQRLTDVVARSTNRLEAIMDPNPVGGRFYRIATPKVP